MWIVHYDVFSIDGEVCMCCVKLGQYSAHVLRWNGHQMGIQAWDQWSIQQGYDMKISTLLICRNCNAHCVLLMTVHCQAIRHENRCKVFFNINEEMQIPGHVIQSSRIQDH